VGRELQICQAGQVLPVVSRKLLHSLEVAVSSVLAEIAKKGLRFVLGIQQGRQKWDSSHQTHIVGLLVGWIGWVPQIRQMRAVAAVAAVAAVVAVVENEEVVVVVVVVAGKGQVVGVEMLGRVVVVGWKGPDLRMTQMEIVGAVEIAGVVGIGQVGVVAGKLGLPIPDSD